MKPFWHIKVGKREFYKIIVILISMACITSCGNSPSFIIPYNDEIAWTKDELIKLYWEHKYELNEVAEIVLTNEALRQRYDNGHYMEIRFETDKEYFTEEEWEKIVDLFEKIRPSMITRSLGEGEDVIYIDFLHRKVNDGNIHVALHYFKNPETLQGYSRGFVSGGKGIEHLDGYWYVAERLTTGSG